MDEIQYPNAMEENGKPQSSQTQSQENTSEHGAKAESAGAPAAAKKTSLPRRIWAKSGLTMDTLKLMVKGGLPPAIALAIYQSTGVADVYSTIGYLIAISSILSFSIMPRAKLVLSQRRNSLVDY